VVEAAAGPDQKGWCVPSVPAYLRDAEPIARRFNGGSHVRCRFSPSRRDWKNRRCGIGQPSRLRADLVGTVVRGYDVRKCLITGIAQSPWHRAEPQDTIPIGLLTNGVLAGGDRPTAWLDAI